MRILMLAQFYDPIIGGEERYVQDLSAHLAHRGHSVAVATLWQPGLPAYAEEDGGVRVYRLRSSLQRLSWLYSEAARQHMPPFPDPGAMHALGAIMERECPDVVHAHNWIVHSFLPLRSRTTAATVVTLHDYSLRCANKNFLRVGATAHTSKSPIRARAGSRTNSDATSQTPLGTPSGTPSGTLSGIMCDGPGLLKCVACARTRYGLAKGAVTALGVQLSARAEYAHVDLFLPICDAVAHKSDLRSRGAAFEVIPSFIADNVMDQRDPQDPHVALLPQEPFLMFAGDQSFQKGISVLLDAYARLRNAPPLVLIGRRFKDVPYTLPPNVLQFDLWPHKAVLEAYHRCLLGVAPSVWEEPFGISAVEAMAAGKPLVASRAGGLMDIVAHEETGLLVEPNDAQALADALARLIADPELCARMGQAASRRAQLFTLRRIGAQIEGAYRRAVAMSQRHGQARCPQG